MDRRDIARLFMTHHSDRAGDDPRRERERLSREVEELGVCGYCIFGGEEERTSALNKEMREAAGRALLVASDLEQGLGQQVAGGTVFPSQMAVGATASPRLAGQVGRAVATEAAATGINVVFAPVADLATEPSNPIVGVRSYGADPAVVAENVRSYVAGCQSVGVAATVKHFPGHGDTLVDSHIDLPVVTAKRSTLESRELVPFAEAVRSGVRLVMMGHIACPELAGSDAPASLEARLVDGLLRAELGFDGVVVTDALTMGAVTRRYGPGEAAVAALLAGADVLLMPDDLDDALGAVVDAVSSGRVTEEHVRRSLDRIDGLISWVSDGYEGASVGLSDANLRSHASLARDVARRGLTLGPDVCGPPPDARLLADALFVVVADPDDAPCTDAVREALAKRAPSARVEMLSGAASDAAGRVADGARRESALVVLVFDRPSAWRGRVGPDERVAATLGAALREHPASAALLFSGPGLITAFGGARWSVCGYDDSHFMLEAALDALFGGPPPEGRLPAPVERGGRAAA